MFEDRISMEQGAGGEAMMRLVEEVLLPEITELGELKVGLEELDDGAALEVGGKTVVFTTDSHTIKPVFFPGGDIGRLAVAGTVNDMAVMGGKPMVMATAMVITEGFPVKDLQRIVKSMNIAAKEAGVSLATGDTKVLESDELDGIIITTTGIGIAETLVTDAGLTPDDKIIVTGNIGEHETAIISQREGMEIGVDIESDVAPLWGVISAVLDAGRITSMKDPTRGGLSGTLNELASRSNVGISIEEDKIPISDPVKNVGEMLGIDPLDLTNEGRAVIGVSPGDVEEVLEAVKGTEYGSGAEVIGVVVEDNLGKVTMETTVGGRRLIRRSVGAPTPRIC